MTRVVSYQTPETSASPRSRLGAWSWLALGVVYAVAGLGLLALVGGAIGVGLTPVGGVPAPAAGLFLMVVASGVLVALRRGRGHAVLVYLEQAVRLNLPLPAMLEAAERAERGRVRRALRDVRQRLEEGSPLAVAVAAALPSLPRRTADLIASAERVGRLPQVLRRLTRPGRAEGAAPAELRGELFLRWYPLLTLLMLGAALAMTLVFVMPKFQEIFADFGLELPPLTRWVIWAAQAVVFPLTAALAVVALFLLGHLVGTIFAPGWASANPFRGLTDRLRWHVPPFRGVVRARAAADACHVIADALESGRPLNWAIDEAARVRTSAVLEARLGRWAERVRRGEGAADAAQAAGMPRLIVGTLRTAGAGGGETPDMLRFLARYYESRFSRAATVARGALLPAAAILTGVPVGAFILGMFLPLVRLTEHLSEMIWSF